MQTTKVRAIAIYTLTIALLCATAIILFRLDYDQWKEKERLLCQVKLDSMAETMRIMEELQNASKTSYDRHRRDNLSFITDTLSGYVTGDGYTGPRLFDDGAVVELRAGRVLWPEGSPAAFSTVTPEALKKGGACEATDADGERVYLLIGKIGGEHYYVDWNDARDPLGGQAGDTGDGEFLQRISEPFDGALLLAATDDPALPLVHESGHYPGVTHAGQLGFTPEMVRQHTAFMDIDGKSCMCVYSELKDGAEVLIYVTPLRTLFRRCLPHVVMVELSALVIIITLCHYLLTVFHYIGSHALTKKQMRRYKPRALRRTVIAAGLTGAVVIFISMAVFQTLDALHEESVIGARAFNRLFEQLQQTTMERLEREKQREAEWYVHYGNQIASLIAQSPEAGSRESLRSYCDRLNIDYLMLFGPDGRELACSADYSGFTIDNGQGKNSGDFRRLLMGVPSIVHEVSTDALTGLTRQYIGVTVSLSSGEDNAPHGALIMAVVPPEIRMSDEEIVRRLHLINSQDILVCYAEPGTGRILYANDAALNGRTLMEYGLPEKVMSDGFTDFATLRGVRSYVTTVKRADVFFIYIIKSAVLFGNTLPASLAATIAYLLVLGVVLVLCLGKYDENAFRAAVGDVDGELREGADQPEAAPGEERHRLSELLVTRKRRRIPREDRTPEARIRSVIMFDVIVLTLLPALFGLRDSTASVGNGTLLQFLLYGDWSRGFNMFALCSIIVVLITDVVLVLVSNGLLSLIASFTGKSGQTICRLLYSLINYIVVLAMLFYVFEYLGLPLSTYVASLSVVSLALSLGAQGMVSDILAGLLIVFEGQFQVGDTVVIDNVQGEVLEIGVRSTRLLDNDNDINYYTNSTIRKIVNKSKRDSAYKMSLTIASQDSMEALEAFFKRELPKIGEGMSAIISGPRLSEIAILSSLGNARNEKVYKVRIKAVCRVEDVDDVEDYVKRQVYLLCERENIRQWDPAIDPGTLPK